MRRLGVMVVVAALAAGCKKSGGNFGKPGEALKVQWKDEETFRLEGHPEVYGQFGDYEGQYQVTLHKFPEGSRWKVMGKEGEVESNIYDIIKIADIQDQLGKVDASDWQKAVVKLEGTLVVDLKGGGRVEVKMPPINAASSVEAVLKKIENGPVVFAGEPPDVDPMQNVMLFSGSLSWKLFGRGSVMQDVDGIAVQRMLPEVKGKKTCSGYKDNAGKDMPSFELLLKETKVVIYVRRTGQVAETKVFPPDEECPRFTFRRAGEKTDDSSIPTQDIEDWLRSRVLP